MLQKSSKKHQTIYVTRFAFTSKLLGYIC